MVEGLEARERGGRAQEPAQAKESSVGQPSSADTSMFKQFQQFQQFQAFLSASTGATSSSNDICQAKINNYVSNRRGDSSDDEANSDEHFL